MTPRQFTYIGAACAVLVGAVLGAANPRTAVPQPVHRAAVRMIKTAADRVENLYNEFALETDAEGNQGYNAAQRAEQQLKLDFLDSFQHPQRNASNLTSWDQEAGQLLNDALKYGGDRTLDAAAMYWGETRLHLPVISAAELIAQAKSLPVSDQPGEREFDAYMANYLAVRFELLDRLALHFRSPDDDIEGRTAPLTLADLQAQLRADEFDRSFHKSRSP
jgi:hypothetical protein